MTILSFLSSNKWASIPYWWWFVSWIHLLASIAFSRFSNIKILPLIPFILKSKVGLLNLDRNWSISVDMRIFFEIETWMMLPRDDNRGSVWLHTSPGACTCSFPSASIHLKVFIACNFCWAICRLYTKPNTNRTCYTWTTTVVFQVGIEHELQQ